LTNQSVPVSQSFGTSYAFRYDLRFPQGPGRALREPDESSHAVTVSTNVYTFV